MVSFRTTEELLAWIVDYFAQQFGAHAILKGGMAMRLLQSPRYTNDADYVFIPFASKNEIKDLIEGKLSQVAGLEYQMKLNSKAMRILVSYGGQNAQVEINVLKDCPSIAASTTLLCSQYGMVPRVVRIMSLPVSFAHKIAAWNERRLMRDLYDIYQYAIAMKILPDSVTLQTRLVKPRVYRGVIPAETLESLRAQLLTTADELNDKSMRELVSLLPEVEFAGLVVRMQMALRLLAERLG
jgi:hypothetical protein